MMAAVHLLSYPARCPQGTLTDAQRNKLRDYATATVRYFTSVATDNDNTKGANNSITGFTHSYYGTGKFRVEVDGVWKEETRWELNRGYGSHVDINEVTLCFLSLAAAYKMGWPTHLPEADRYSQELGTNP